MSIWDEQVPGQQSGYNNLMYNYNDPARAQAAILTDQTPYLMQYARAQQQPSIPYPKIGQRAAPNNAPWVRHAQPRGMQPGMGGNDPYLGADPDTVNGMLGQIAPGLHIPQGNEINPNVNLPNTGFFGNHPKFAGALDMGLMAAAMSHGGNTIGESISGAASGIMGAVQARKQNIANQMNAPLAMAGQIQQMQAGQDAHMLSQAHAGAYNAEADYRSHQLDLRQQALDLKDEQINNGFHLNPYTGDVFTRSNGQWQRDPGLSGDGKDLKTNIFNQKKQEFKDANGRDMTTEEQWKFINGMDKDTQANKKLGKYPPSNRPTMNPADAADIRDSSAKVKAAQAAVAAYDKLRPSQHAKAGRLTDEAIQAGRAALVSQAESANMSHDSLMGQINTKYKSVKGSNAAAPSKPQTAEEYLATQPK